MRSIKIWLLALGALALVTGVTAAAATAGDGHDHHGDRHGRHCHHGDHGRHGTSVCGLDESWLKTSIQGDVFEIRGGQLALKKSSNQAVRTLAQRLITDHTKSLQDALALAQKYHVDVQAEPTPTQHWQLEELAEMSGAIFDHDYAQLEALDHVQDIQETTDEVQLGCNAEIRHDAAQEIPTLHVHLQLSKQALATTKED